MTHEEKNIGGGAELLGSDEQKVSQMLSGLKRVEAPKDFDFHLKARIAKGRPEEARPASLFPILKYALPLALFLFVAAGLILNSSYSEWRGGPTVVENGVTPEARPAANSVTTVQSPEAAATPLSTFAQARPSADENVQIAASPKKPVTGGRSIDFPSSPSRSLPPGGFTDRTGGTASPPSLLPKGSQKDKYTAAEALKLLGIEANFANGGWNVRSVKTNEVADLIGVKVDDKLVAIDGKPIDDKTEFIGKVEATTIRVIRGGGTMDLNAKNKPK